jgi:antitoxin ParD1/3/4
MTAVTARNVSLTDRLDTFVEQQVATGRHQSASEVVREALRRYEADLAAEAACIEMIRGIAHAGRDAIARGDFAVIDSDDARQALFRRITGKAAVKLSEVG